MDELYTKHYSVLYEECLNFFKQANSESETKYFADMTFGGGGHTFGIVKEISNAKVFSVDQDPDAIKNGNDLIAKYDLEKSVHLLKMNFSSFPQWVKLNRPELGFDGILIDLGVSSHHFDKFERGFSFREDAELDMRMDYENGSLETAADILNNYTEEDIANIIFKYGEERFSRRIAKAIVEFRRDKQLRRTKQLEDIVFHCYPKNLRHKKIHPATKTFQALRIFVNQELEVLEKTLNELFELLNTNGVLSVISFHSLEDRIVKHKFKEIFQTDKNTAKILTKKPIYPTEREIRENARSRSAKLRVIQKVDQSTQGGVRGTKKKKAESIL
ncbi:MAG: 16S rRNA (cytosine(1402)-N(4))-methyltransferase RsmH [Bacteriovoracaceae bacterium]|jgi:16S rRNA (cytosine1402-N4)-methyltransferase|nr:16S rRNA (cytosine(1402)-N(4))-methyltransferase RsmH [Bacteriovoracaceae bacterium]